MKVKQMKIDYIQLGIRRQGAILYLGLEEMNYPNLSLLLKGLRLQKTALLKYDEEIISTASLKQGYVTLLKLNIVVNKTFDLFTFVSYPHEDRQVNLNDLTSLANKLNIDTDNHLFNTYLSYLTH